LTPVLASAGMVGILLGGHWMWLGFGIMAVVVIGGDLLFGDDSSQSDYKYPWIVQLPLHLAFPILSMGLLSLAWSSGKGDTDFLGIGLVLNNIFDYNFIASRNQTTPSDFIGGFISVGFLVAGYGTNVAHELTHRIKSLSAMIEGRLILSMSCNADFSIEHVYGHHVTVGTDDDPATARRGENVYKFFFRSSYFGHISAWKLEINRLQKRGKSLVSFSNQMIKGYLMSLMWVYIFYYAGDVLGITLFFAQAIFAKFILEVVNYMEHYGLTRKSNEPIGPQHSWNTNKRMSGIILYTLTRHSAHHEKPRVPFWKLDPYTEAPQMPFGYLTTLLVCMIPPFWYRIINPKLDKWDVEFSD